MLKILFSLSFSFLLILQMSLAAATTAANNAQLAPINCAPQLQKSLVKILNIAEARSLITAIQQEGPIQIEVSNESLSKQFGAFWDETERTICVNIGSHSSEGEVIGSILFELHNAAVNSKLEYYDNLAVAGKIDRESYIQSIEYLEYENSKKAAKIAEKGIAMGIFSPSARLPTYRNFEEHYRFQKIGGHSAYIGSTYDQLAPRT